MERINKLLAHAGVGSRRQCDALIRAGRVAIDGRQVHDLGTKADPEAHRLTVDGKPVGVERPVYWLVNKPRGVVCTNHDPAGRTRAVDLVPHVAQRVYTVGRLDEMSEGLLLLTNDGDLAFQLMHPRFGVEKTYLVQVQGQPSKGDLAQLLQGVWLSDGKVRARRVRQVKRQGESTWLRIVLAEGKNREVRRMLAKQGHKVLTLKREAIGPVQLDRLPKGKARRLSGTELEALRQSASRRPKASTEPEAAGTPPERDRRPPEALPRRPARPQRTRRP
jgi:23S rRNA pseudouridine2605 synthase